MPLRQLCHHIPRASGIRTLCARASVILLGMDSWRVLVCCGFGSIRRSVRVRFWLVILSLVCVGQVYGMHVNLPLTAVYGLLRVSSFIRWSILFLVCRAAAGGASLWWWFLWPARVQSPFLLFRLPASLWRNHQPQECSSFGFPRASRVDRVAGSVASETGKRHYRGCYSRYWAI